MVKHWNTLLREVVVSPSVEKFKTQLDTALSNLIWLTLLEQGAGLEPQRDSGSRRNW